MRIFPNYVIKRIDSCVYPYINLSFILCNAYFGNTLLLNQEERISLFLSNDLQNINNFLFDVIEGKGVK